MGPIMFLHALGQSQTNEVLQWDRTDLYFLNALSGYQGNTDCCLDALGLNFVLFFICFGPVSEVGKDRSNTRISACPPCA